MIFHERHPRTFLKSVSWFVIGFTVSFFVLVYFNNGDYRVSLIEASAIQAFKFIFFYLHERVWNRSHFGKEYKENHSK